MNAKRRIVNAAAPAEQTELSASRPDCARPYSILIPFFLITAPQRSLSALIHAAASVGVFSTAVAWPSSMIFFA